MNDWSSILLPTGCETVTGTMRVLWINPDLEELLGGKRYFSMSCAWDFSAMQRTKRLRRKLGRLIRRGIVQKVK